MNETEKWLVSVFKKSRVRPNQIPPLPEFLKSCFVADELIYSIDFILLRRLFRELPRFGRPEITYSTFQVVKSCRHYNGTFIKLSKKK